MKTMEIANELVALCREGKNFDVMQKHYAKDVVSYEVNEPMKETRGLEAVLGKAKWWVDNHEVHDRKVDGPWPNGDQFTVRHTYTITPKATGKKIVMDEIALYTVKGGKIVEEKFFYGA
jgi:ketosteroid isomerase-like protein